MGTFQLYGGILSLLLIMRGKEREEGRDMALRAIRRSAAG